MTEGKHYYSIKNILENKESLTGILGKELYISLPFNVKEVILFTEKGYLFLNKVFIDDLSFEVQDLLIDNYFNMKEYIQNNIALSEDMLLSRAVLVATKKIEQLENKVKEMQPKAEYTEKVLDSEGLCTTTQIGKDVGLTARALNNLLSEYKIQYKQGKQWFLYAKYQNLGYTKSTTYYDENTDITYQTTKWTEKGRKFILDFLQGLGYKLQNEVE